MSGPSPTGQNGMLLFGLGLASCAVLGVMHQILVYYRDSLIVPREQNKSQYITQDVEDSLKLSTLGKLLDSPNYCVQETTTIIIWERALHDEATMGALLYYITRPEHAEREKGIRALTMMMNSATIQLMHKPEAYAALVKSLEYSMNDYPHNAFDTEWDNWNLRDVVEKDCLIVLGQLVEKFGVDGLVKSRFINRWLVKEPWGDTEESRMKMFSALTAKHQRLHDIIIQPLLRSPKATKQLLKAKLLHPESERSHRQRPIGMERSPDIHPLNDIRMINGESTAGEDFEAMFVERPRRNQSSEEENIRRRHREAMVLNDGGPLRRGDIIQRERRDE